MEASKRARKDVHEAEEGRTRTRGAVRDPNTDRRTPGRDHGQLIKGYKNPPIPGWEEG